MFVFQQQFSAIAVIPIHDIYPRLAEVGQSEQQPLLDLLKLPRLDDILPRLVLEGVTEHLVFLTEFRSQVGVDKGNIVVNAANLKDFLSSQAEFFVPISLFFQIVALLPFQSELAGVPAMLDVTEQFNAE